MRKPAAYHEWRKDERKAEVQIAKSINDFSTTGQ